MKTILISLLLSLPLSFAHAVELEAKSFPDLLKQIEQTEFTYAETGMMFGYVSIKSCMFKSDDLIVFRNYCSPVRNYPAQGYTVFSREFGVMELYEEVIDGKLKRDISIDQFPAIVAPYLESALPSLTLADYHLIQEKMYNKFFPGCWSTNFSFYTEDKDVNCTSTPSPVIGFAQWAQETQAIVNDEVTWKALMKTLDQKFPRR